MLKSISVSRIPSTACISCFAERAKTAICMDQICALEAVVNGLKLQLNSLNLAGSGQNATPNPNLSESSLNFLSESGYWEDVKTSEQLYGAIEVDSFKITLKSLPSLKNRANLVDAYYDLLVEETKVTKPQAARKLLVKLLQAGRELTNACSILDRVKCLETMSVYHERNANHEIHFSKLCDSCTRIKLKFATRPLLALPPQVQTFRDTLRQIPSFQGSLNMIDELCSYGCYGCEESEDFFHYSLLLYQLESISCNIEDRTKFWMAFDIMSQSINGAIDGLLSQVSNLTM
ncbi:hypothetical protein BDR26DRAFT_873324 [Obelidium mucronatum]|nr:hypothetical protein BDR26DRAFT_873324 [Obelidium mucronatum]